MLCLAERVKLLQMHIDSMEGANHTRHVKSSQSATVAIDFICHCHFGIMELQQRLRWPTTETACTNAHASNLYTTWAAITSLTPKPWLRHEKSLLNVFKGEKQLNPSQYVIAHHLSEAEIAS